MIYTNNAECEIIFLRSSLFNRTGRYFFQLLSYHMVDDEAASVTLAFPELAGIIVAVIQKDNAQTMGQAVGLVDFALVGSAIGQERPFFGI